jgi:hypothetical protein
MLFVTKSLYKHSLDKHAKFVYLKNNLNSIFYNTNMLSDITKEPLKQNALLFLNNGLTQSNITKLRSLFLSYNLSFTNIPLRSLNSNAIKPRNRLKYFSGQLFILHSQKSFPLPFLHHFLLYFIANNKNSLKRNALSNLGFSKHFTSLLHSRFETELSNELLP